MTPDNVKLTYTPFNLGSQPYLNQDNDCDEKDNKVRSYFYQHDTVDPKFPLLVCKTRIRECLEMNLFLIHRRLGIYAIKPNPKVDNESPAFSQAYYANLA